MGKGEVEQFPIIPNILPVKRYHGGSVKTKSHKLKPSIENWHQFHILIQLQLESECGRKSNLSYETKRKHRSKSQTEQQNQFKHNSKWKV